MTSKIDSNESISVDWFENSELVCASRGLQMSENVYLKTVFRKRYKYFKFSCTVAQIVDKQTLTVLLDSNACYMLLIIDV